jgi:pimeloyl-ACP methyl ester carboxylesterase
MQQAYLQCKTDLAKQNILLSDFSSLQSAADAEDIRKQLGIKKWNIYSVSHGTTVALNMMRKFSGNIQSVILDSPFPPNAPWSDFVHPFDISFKVLEENIKRDSINAKLFPSIRNDFIKVSKQLRNSPLLIPLASNTGASKNYLFDDGDFAWSVWTAMLSPRTIPLVPLALKEMAEGKDSILMLWAKRFNDPNAFGEFALAQSKAILLYESKPGSEEEKEQFIIQNFPDFAALIVPGRDSVLTELFRPDSPSMEYFDPVSSNIPTLILSGEYDPVCPPIFAKVTAKTLGQSQSIVVPAASHAAMNADDCTRNIVRRFYNDPLKKLETNCVDQREKIKFVISDLISLLR